MVASCWRLPSSSACTSPSASQACSSAPSTSCWPASRPPPTTARRRCRPATTCERIAMPKAVEVEIDNPAGGKRKLTVHSLKARSMPAFYNAMPEMQAFLVKLQQAMRPPEGQGPVTFSDDDFDKASELIAAMTDLSLEQVADLDMFDWYAVLTAAVTLAESAVNFTPAPRATAPAAPATTAA